MGKSSAALVREGLKIYADRGVFRSFAEEKGKNGKVKFSFLLFDENLVNLEFTEKEHTLVIRNMLKQVGTDMYKDLQDFLNKLYDLGLPPQALNKHVEYLHKANSVGVA